jgi:UDP-glucuronate 4-epimerase
MRILITGAAGFIGFHLVRHLAAHGHQVLGVDNLNAYYDPSLKRERLDLLAGLKGQFRFVQTDIADETALGEAVSGFTPDVIVHLAAQAGVRFSIEKPLSYVDSNVRGQVNMLELARRTADLRLFIYASSSSVYGDRAETPFRESDRCDHPASVYAATKRAAELVTDAYGSLYELPAVGLRFFTVYGTYGRPDMAYWMFTDAILNDRPIRLFNQGDMRRDFTHVGDVVEGVRRIVEGAPGAGHRIYNIGCSKPVRLGDFVSAIEAAAGRSAIVEAVEMQPGDVHDTYADVTRLMEDYGYRPATTIEEGMAEFVSWFRQRRLA